MIWSIDFVILGLIYINNHFLILKAGSSKGGWTPPSVTLSWKRSDEGGGGWMPPSKQQVIIAKVPAKPAMCPPKIVMVPKVLS